MKALNERHGYRLNLVLLSVDEGITGYRDDSLQSVMRNRDEYGLPLKIVSYGELYGWTMDAIVREIGTKNNCTFCGVFRRQALDRGAMLVKVGVLYDDDALSLLLLLDFLIVAVRLLLSVTCDEVDGVAFTIRRSTRCQADKIVTGHNADDIAETVLMNILRGDIARLSRCTDIITGSEGNISRCKPFKFTYEKEIVMYAYFRKLDYFSTECIYAPNAYR